MSIEIDSETENGTMTVTEEEIQIIKCTEKQHKDLVKTIKNRWKEINMDKQIPQIVIRFKAGDHGVFDVEEGLPAFDSLVRDLNHSMDTWIWLGKTTVVDKDQIDRLFFFPEGYKPQQPPAQV